MAFRNINSGNIINGIGKRPPLNSAPIESPTLPLKVNGTNTSSNGNDAGRDHRSKLLWLLTFRARQSKFTFDISSQFADENVDDIIFRYENPIDNKSRIIFLQAKTNIEKVKISWKTFFTDKDYDLYKYFLAYRNIKQKCVGIENVTICTDNMLARNVECFKRLPNIDDNFKKIGHCFKLTDDTKDILKYNFIAKEIIDCILMEDTFYTTFLTAYQKSLTDAIFDKSLKGFDANFINDSLSANKPFLKVLKESFKRELRSAKLDKVDLSFMKNVYTKQVTTDELQQREDQMDAEIEEFIQNFVLAVDLEETKIIDRIISDLASEYDISEFDIPSNFLDGRINKWSKLINTGKMKIDDIDNYFEEFDCKMWMQKLIAMRVPILEEKVPVFRLDEELLGMFIPQSRPSLLVICCDEVDTAAIKAYQHAQFIFRDPEEILYLNTNLPNQIFERGLQLFSGEKNTSLLIVECGDQIDVLNKYKSQIIAVLNKSKMKTLAVITSPNNENEVQFTNIKNAERMQFTGSKFADLTDESIKEILESKIEFQGKEVKWDELLETEDVVFLNLSLKQLLRTQSIDNSSAKFIDNSQIEEFIPRKLVHKNIIKSEVEDDCKRKKLGDNVLALSKTNLTQYLRRNVENIHVLKKSYITIQTPDKQLKLIEQVIWIETYGDISKLRYYVNHEFFFPIQNVLIDLEENSKVLILSGYPGSGKSLYLDYITTILRDVFPNYWIKKIDFKNLSTEFYSSAETKINNEESAVKFLAENVLKLESDLDMKLFRHACLITGKVQLLFDGFDEVPTEYLKVILNMIRLLSLTYISRIFISTRPEHDEALETQFSQLKYTMLPFDKENQENFIVRCLEKNTKIPNAGLTKIAKTLIETLGTQQNDKNKVFLEVPLLMKLIAEYLEWKILESKSGISDVPILCQHIQNEKLSALKLFDNYVHKKIMLYLSEAFEYTPEKNQEEIETVKKRTFEMHQKVALECFFERNLIPIDIEGFSDAEKEEICRIGIVQEADGNRLEFINRSFAEYFLASFVVQKFEVEGYQDFIVNCILVKNGLQLTRNLLNFYILDVSENAVTLYGNSLLNQHDCKDSSFHVASREQNPNLFNFMYQSIVAKTADKDKAQNLLLSVGEHNKVFLFDHIMNAANLEFLEKLCKDFGEEFLVELLTKCDGTQTNSFMIAIYNKSLFVELLKFVNNLKVTNAQETIFLSTDSMENTILHKFGMHYNISLQKLYNLTEFLNILKENLDVKILQKLLIAKNENKITFLDSVGQYQSEKDLLAAFDWITTEMDYEFYSRDILFIKMVVEKILGNPNWDVVKFLKYLKSTVSIQKIMDVFKEMMHHVHVKNLTKMLDWVRSEETHFFTEILLPSDQNCEAFLHWCSGYFKNISDLIEILKYLRNSLNPDVFKLLILKDNEVKKNFLHYICEKMTYLSSVDLKELLDWITTNVVIFKQFFQAVDKAGNNFFHIFVKHGNLKNVNLILNHLKHHNLVDAIVMKQNFEKQTILHIADSPYDWMILLQWIKMNVGMDGFKKLITMKDKNKKLFFRKLKKQYMGVLVELLYYLRGCVKCESVSGILKYSEERYESIPLILSWVKELFGKEFYNYVVFFKDESGDTLLNWYGEQKTDDLFDFLDHLKANLDKAKIQELMLKLNFDNESLLYNCFQKFRINDIIDLLNWIKELDNEFFKKLICKEDNEESLLHQLAKRDAYDFDSFLDFLKENISDETTFKDNLLKKSKFNNLTFLQTSSLHQSPYNFQTTLSWLRKELPEKTFITLFLPETKGGTLLHYIAQSPSKMDPSSTLMEIISWLYSLDSDFVADIILFTDEYDKLFFNYLPIHSYLEMVKMVKEKFSARTLRDVIFTRMKNRQTCLHHYAHELSEDDSSSTYFISLIEWLLGAFDSTRLGRLCAFKCEEEWTFLQILVSKRSPVFFEVLEMMVPVLGSNFLKGLLLGSDWDGRGIFHIMLLEEIDNTSNILEYFQKILETFKKHFDTESAKKALEHKNLSDKSFLYFIKSNFRSSDDSSGETILDLLNCITEVLNDDDETVKNLLLSKDTQEQSLLHFYADKSLNLCYSIMNFIDENFDIDDLKSILLSEDKKSQSAINLLFSKRYKEDNVDKVLNFILEKFDKDEQFFSNFGSKKKFVLTVKNYPRIGGRSGRMRVPTDSTAEDFIGSDCFLFDGIPMMDRTGFWRF